MRVFAAVRFIFLTALLTALLPGVSSAQIGGGGGGGGLTITTSPALPSGAPGSFYRITLAASGGLAPYQWVAVTALPPGLALSTSGVLSGTPLTANQYSFTIQVSDSSSPPFAAQQIFYLTIGSTPLVCSVNTGFTPVLRSEGLTEAAGDIVIVCTGGASATAGQPVPQVNVTVSFPVPVTSRVLNGKASEALLLIDEPNSGLPPAVPGFGPAEPFTLCKTPLSGCPAWAQQAPGAGGATYEVAVNSSSASAMPVNAAPNVFQSVVSGNQLTFFGVPVLPPGNSAARVLRITNVRLDASQIAINTGVAPVQATIVSSDPKDLPLAKPTPIVAFTPTASLTTSTTTPPQLAACNSQTLEQAAILTFKELFSSAFKTRVDSTVAGQPSGQSAALVQDATGTVYQSESDFTLAVPGSVPAGLANFGTRLKAVFRNVPAGVRLFVSLTNVTADPTTGLATGEAPKSSTPFAELVKLETGAFSVPAGAHTPGTNIGLVEITPSHEGRAATAVWEVVSAQPTAIDTLQFGVFVSYNGGHSGTGAATVDLSYAPTNATSEEEDPAVIPRFYRAQPHPVPLLRSCGSGASERD